MVKLLRTKALVLVVTGCFFLYSCTLPRPPWSQKEWGEFEEKIGFKDLSTTIGQVYGPIGALLTEGIRQLLKKALTAGYKELEVKLVDSKGQKTLNTVSIADLLDKPEAQGLAANGVPIGEIPKGTRYTEDMKIDVDLVKYESSSAIGNSLIKGKQSEKVITKGISISVVDK